MLVLGGFVWCGRLGDGDGWSRTVVLLVVLFSTKTWKLIMVTMKVVDARALNDKLCTFGPQRFMTGDSSRLSHYTYWVSTRGSGGGEGKRRRAGL